MEVRMEVLVDYVVGSVWTSILRSPVGALWTDLGDFVGRNHAPLRGVCSNQLK